MDERDVTERLRALGRRPVPTETRAHHLQQLAGTPARRPKRFGRVAVAAAAMIGFLAGSTGLAVAGALPDTAQDVAHDVLAVVRVDVPEGTRGACVSAAARDKTLDKAAKKAAKDACPKGGPPDGVGPDDAPGAPDATPGTPGDQCHGKPPWAGRNDLTPEQRDAMKAERAATCGTEADDQTDDQADDQQPDDQQTDDTTPTSQAGGG